MENEIKLLKNNDNRDISDLEWIEEFYYFLQGTTPEGITLGHGHSPKLTKNKAFAIIWYLQEHFPLLPDQIEKCSVCGDLYNSYSSGYHSEVYNKFWCNSCCPPFIDEKEEKLLEYRRKRAIKKATE